MHEFEQFGGPRGTHSAAHLLLRLKPSDGFISMVPSPVTHTSGRLLEFEALREMLRAYSSSPLGHARVTELAPTTDLAYIRRQQQLTAEVREFLRAGNRFEVARLLDPTT